MLPRSSTMANLPQKMPRMALFAYTICLLRVIPIIEGADPTFRYVVCPNTTKNSPPDNNDNLADLDSLPSNSNESNGFYSFAARSKTPVVAFNFSNPTMSNGFFWLTNTNGSTLAAGRCIHEVTHKVCGDCINYAYRDAVERCPGSTEVTIIYDECKVRLSKVYTFHSSADQNPTETTRAAGPNFLFVECPNETQSPYAGNSTYPTNLQTLLSGLSSNSYASNGFYYSSAGSTAPDVAYGLFMCRGDISAAVCQDCVTYAAVDVVLRCPRSKRVTIWYDECMLRYSNDSFLSDLDTSFRQTLVNPQNVTHASSFQDALREVMDKITTKASRDDVSNKFATHERSIQLQTVYGLVQCTPDLSQSDCYSCLRTCISTLASCCDVNMGARVLLRSCYVRYETYPFYSTSSSTAAPPPALRDSPPSSSTTSSLGKAGVSWQVVIAIVVPTGVFILLSVAIFYFMTRRAKKNYNYTKDAKGGDDISTLQYLHYDLRTIRAATNTFSEDNKLGEGGFGQVYKGSLPDGQDVAVKRLSRMSSQGVQELKNEVVLLAKLQHRNLVKLLGFCFEGEEKLLIFEFVPNKSLDSFLFDQQEHFLDWSRRYKIIGGIARGMSYLHEDSQFRIIHRDLKASNILLDRDMNAKISDLGIAQILRGDQTQGNASEIIGTLGYMSPEYAMYGRFSTESDVFSFGVVVLEIITGMKSNNFCQSDIAKDLQSYAWKFWNDGAPLNLRDPTQKGPYSKDEVIKCIHIALLCVQDDPSARPSMATVVAMLDGYFATLSLPQQPAYHGWSRPGLELGRSSDKLLDCSMNEVSISELEPR